MVIDSSKHTCKTPVPQASRELLSRLIRNVPMLNYLEVSPFLLLVPCIAHFRVLRFRWSAS